MVIPVSWTWKLLSLCIMISFLFYRSHLGPTCCEDRSKFERNSDSIPNGLCGLLSVTQAYSAIGQSYKSSKSFFGIIILVQNIVRHVYLGFSFFITEPTCNTCRKQCQVNMPCAFLLSGVQCSCRCFCFSSSSQKIQSMLFLHLTFLCLGSSHSRSFFPYYVFRYLTASKISFVASHQFLIFLCRATLLPAIRRFLPKSWNNDHIVWKAPYFSCINLSSTH